MVNFYHLSLRLGALLLATLPAFSIVSAQDDNSNKKDNGNKEESNRNVMLNAASANGPREIQIGLPSADVNVLENGLPVTYATNPRSVNSLWRGDASLSHQGLLKIAETAITTGNIGYAVNSFTQLGQDGFHGTLNYKTNHFGLQEMSLNLNGSFGKGWYYSGSQERSRLKVRRTKTAHRLTRQLSQSVMLVTEVSLRLCTVIVTAILSTPTPHSRHRLSMSVTVA